MHMVRPVLLIALAAPLSVTWAQTKNLWNGVAAGPYTVGFRFQHGIDATRNITAGTRGTALGIAVWYPAVKARTARAPITQLDYRLLEFSVAPAGAALQAFIDAQAAMMVAWRHVGIVPMNVAQARASLEADGRAIRDAAHAPGRFPVVLVLGGAWYLSTTAEILASHGFVVAAPVRFTDVDNEVPALEFSGYVENAVRDGEWALAELGPDTSADTNNVSALGHGGGGLQALVLAMRSRAIRAVANIDAANFSARTNPRQVASYQPSLLRVPYLYIATAATRGEADQFKDFEDMRFSRRVEVVLRNPELRHHDLSNAGRAVAAYLGIRGEAQDAILRDYAAVQAMLVRFLRGDAAVVETPDLVTVREAVEPAPTLRVMLQSLDARRLIDAWQRDPEAPVFSEDSLQTIISTALTRRQFAVAAQLARFALQLHRESVPIHELAARAVDAAGDRPAARELARHCAELPLPNNDWRARFAQASCKNF